MQKILKKVGLRLGQRIFWLIGPFRRWYFPRYARTRIILSHKGRILFVRGWLSDGNWTLPGGGLHRLENPTKGVIREIKEELNLNLSQDRIKYLGEIRINNNDYSTKYFVFSCNLDDPPEIKIQKLEIADYLWINKTKLQNFPISVSAKTILARWSKQR